MFKYISLLNKEMADYVLYVLIRHAALGQRQLDMQPFVFPLSAP